MLNFRMLPAGDTAIVIEFGDRIDRQISSRVLALARCLNAVQLNGLIETVPTFRSLMVHYDPLVLPTASLIAHISKLMQESQGPEQAGRLWRLPTCYDARLAPDLEDVATRTGLSPAQVIERHSAITYHVYMLGFLPGQAYLGDVPAELTLARRETPRKRIPAGSLAIANTMTCIFPLETPCGWHLIGRSPVALWERQRALLAPGDKVIFTPISFREYEILLTQAAQGTLAITPTDDVAKAAA